METATFQRVAKTRSIVTLSGGRRYIINPGDISKAVLWLPGARVKIENSDDAVYPVIIRLEDHPDKELRANTI